ncbi:MAG: hypothetical protein QGG14_05470 [Planctomycetota bacterium]|nr:hypothetical protein [Planctomycetota bacterium]
MLALTPAVDDELGRALEARQWRRAGRVMARMGVDRLDFKVLRRIVEQDAAALTAMQVGLRDQRLPSPELSRLLVGVAWARRRDPAQAVTVLEPLLGNGRLRPVIAGPLGRSALHLCRSGLARGIVVLRAIRDHYPRAAWANANVALAERLLGRYKAAATTYRALVATHGELAWVCNDLGLLAQARGSTAEALRHYQRGASEGVVGKAGDRDTCRGNEALLLLERDGSGDRDLALGILRGIVSRDPSRSRAAYWLAQASRPGGRLPSGKPLHRPDGPPAVERAGMGR